MTLSMKIALVILSVSILSYGLSGASYAQAPVPELPISVTTDKATYSQGEVVTVSGKVKSPNQLLGLTLTLQVLGPGSQRIHVDQVEMALDGSYRTTFTAAGPLWKSGDYEILIYYHGQQVRGGFGYVADDAPPEPDTCDPGEVRQNGECIVIPPEPSCPEGQTLKGGECVNICGPGTSMVDGKCVVDPPKCDDDEVLKDGECVPKEPECTVPGMEVQDGKCVSPCGEGTVLDNGKCVPVDPPGTCLIATAAYGTELAPQVQFLRELRDNTLLSTESGTSFMTGFNSLYYSFSPAVADLQRENPAFREATKLLIAPMLSSLSIMTLADEGSEASVLGLGISVIALNIGMYIAAPVAVGFSVRRHLRLRK